MSDSSKKFDLTKINTPIAKEVRLKWVKNKSPDHIIDTETDLNAACLLKDAFKPSPTDFLTAKSSANWQNASRLHSSCSWLSPQVSTHSSHAKVGVGLGLSRGGVWIHPSTNEHLFTNCTRNFIGTLDYIFYAVEPLLEVLDEDSLRKDTALPSPEWSSDHIALLAEFCRIPRQNVMAIFKLTNYYLWLSNAWRSVGALESGEGEADDTDILLQEG
ncbi:hypothetical protein SLEP1_g42874 [Rubroshorea leprosula]|uniref:Uncharacterized protein n=1 Tax=Rubroshorea leprosula TaxID=152421 RepID=A0AAV5LBL9_9ROSI|nr:hypothetical protein SLEP1_g42874 [Rubroshorea leprosula]